MVSLMNGLSAAGAAVSSFAGTAGLEQQKADLAQQGMVLADQLAHTSKTAEISQAGSIAATAAQAESGYRMAEQAPRLTTELQVADKSAQATLGAAGISAAASKYAADATSANVTAELAAAAPGRAEAVLSQREQTVTTRIANENAANLQTAHAALVAETGKTTPDPSKITTLTNQITALEASAGSQAAIVTAKTALYHTDLENVQSLNTRITAAMADMAAHPELNEGDKAKQQAGIDDLKNQLVGAQISLKYSSDVAHGAIAATAGAPASGGSAAPASGRPPLGSILTPPGDKPANAPATASTTAPGALPAPVAAALERTPAATPSTSGPSNTPPALLKPISETGTAFARQQLAVMDQIDAGKKVTGGADVLDYANKTPAQRATIRAGIEQSIAGAATQGGIGLNNGIGR